jgi:hypothetical protein
MREVTTHHLEAQMRMKAALGDAKSPVQLVNLNRQALLKASF